MEGELSVKIVGLNEIYLAVHDGGDNKIDEGTLKKEHGESTTLYIKEHTAEGVRLQLVFHDSGGDGYTDDFARRNNGTGKEKMGKKPDIMALEKCNGKLLEFLYAESSRIVCSNTKKADDGVKLWRELLDGISYIYSACKPICNQFGVVGIQVAGEKIYLSVLVKDASGILRYFHLDHAEIPLTSEVSWRTKALIRLLLTLRNIIIVNKNLLVQATGQAVSHPPRNTYQSPTVSSP
ncbi:13630_t:CDS:2 [Entrophospora sp. SA101]|nr:13630_t:CDS:2 [Entrophospora sp. SA101]